MGKKQFPDQHLEMAGKKYLEKMIVNGCFNGTII